MRSKENIAEPATARESETRQGSVEDRHHQPLHRLSQQHSSLDSADSGETGYHVTRPYPQHDITGDYYLSEEEELAMIAHQSRHYDSRWVEGAGALQLQLSLSCNVFVCS